MLDGVYRLTDGAPVFHTAPAPTAEQLETLLTRIIKRVLKVLTRKGALVEQAPETLYLPDTALADQLVRLKVDIMITGGPTSNRAAKEATVMISIVNGL